MTTITFDRPAHAARSAAFVAAIAFACVFGCSVAAIETSRHGDSIAAFWPSNGVALVLLLRISTQRETRAAAALGIIAGLLGANLLCGNGLANSLWFTAGNAVEVAVAYAMMRVPRRKSLLQDGGAVTRLLRRLMSAALVGPACGALVGAVGLSFGSDTGFAQIWLQWWLPSALGLLIVVPFGLFVSRESFLRLRDWKSLRDIVIGAILLAGVCSAILFFSRLAMIIFAAPIVMLAVVRLRAVGVAATIGALACFVIPLAASPDWSRYSAVSDVAQRLALVQSYLIVNALVALALSALLDEREAMARVLETRRAESAGAAQARLRLLMNVAHEIRTPLNAIQTCAELVGGAGPLTPKQTELLSVVAGASRQLQVLASDLLDSARLEHRSVALSPSWFRAGEIVEQAVREVRASLQWDGPVQIDLSDTAIWADPQRFRQVVVNLISNAAKFGGAHGPVRIGLSVSTDAAALWVSDCGPGLQPGREHEVFEPFSQASDNRVTAASAGVGLSLVKQLVEAHGGRVRCTSTPYIETRVQAEFPLLHAPGAVTSSEIRAAATTIDPRSVL